jgi:hypothetical protein
MVGLPEEDMGLPEAETKGIDNSGSPTEEVGEIAGCSIVVDLGRWGEEVQVRIQEEDPEAHHQQ